MVDLSVSVSRRGVVENDPLVCTREGLCDEKDSDYGYRPKLMATTYVKEDIKAPRRVLPKHDVGYVYDERLLLHDMPFDEKKKQKEESNAYDEHCHPENPSRLKTIMAYVKERNVLSRCHHIFCRLATKEEILSVHHSKHYEWVESLSTLVPKEVEKQSIYYNQYTSQCCKLSVGGLIDLSTLIHKRTLRAGLAIIRPPGHHAEPDSAFGFCFYNNASIVASHLKNNCGVKRILIFDWDVHHGNGTQKIFYDDPTVLYISIHRYENGKFFPPGKEGHYTKTGSGNGQGYNINIPFSNEKMGNSEYLYTFFNVCLPIIQSFKPTFVIVSAGFDAVITDPLGQYKCTPSLFGFFTLILYNMFGRANFLITLEGGYSPKVIAQCVYYCFRALLDDGAPLIFKNKDLDESLTEEMEDYHLLYEYESPNASCLETIYEVRKYLKAYWPCLVDNSQLDLNHNLKGIDEMARMQDIMMKNLCSKYENTSFINMDRCLEDNVNIRIQEEDTFTFNSSSVFIGFYNNFVTNRFSLVEFPVHPCHSLIDGIFSLDARHNRDDFFVWVSPLFMKEVSEELVSLTDGTPNTKDSKNNTKVLVLLVHDLKTTFFSELPTTTHNIDTLDCSVYGGIKTPIFHLINWLDGAEIPFVDILIDSIHENKKQKDDILYQDLQEKNNQCPRASPNDMDMRKHIKTHISSFITENFVESTHFWKIVLLGIGNVSIDVIYSVFEGIEGVNLFLILFPEITYHFDVLGTKNGVPSVTREVNVKNVEKNKSKLFHSNSLIFYPSDSYKFPTILPFSKAYGKVISSGHNDLYRTLTDHLSFLQDFFRTDIMNKQ